MTASRRVRTALLRLAAPFRRRHPIMPPLLTHTYASGITVVLQGAHYPACNSRCRGEWHWLETNVEAAAAAERDPSDEAGA